MGVLKIENNLSNTDGLVVSFCIFDYAFIGIKDARSSMLICKQSLLLIWCDFKFDELY